MLYMFLSPPGAYMCNPRQWTTPSILKKNFNHDINKRANGPEMGTYVSRQIRLHDIPFILPARYKIPLLYYYAYTHTKR